MSGTNKRFFKISKDNQLINFNENEQTIFDGVMLGDGLISKDSNLFIVSQKRSRKEYLYYICKELKIDSNRVFDRPNKIDSRTNKTYEGSYLRTLSDYSFY